jgi:Tfp pilus assembly protein PilF
MVMLAVSYMRQNLLEEATECLEEVMRNDPKNRIAPLMAGTVGLRGGNPNYAETHFHKALEIDPLSVPALMGLAELHEQQKRPDAAMEVLNRAVEIQPQSPDVRRRIATLLARQEQLDEARAHLSCALTANPGDPRTTVQLARLLVRTDKPAEAISVLSTALAHNPGNQPLLKRLGDLKFAQKDFAGAEAAFGEILSKEEGRNRNASARLSMAAALIAQKKLPEARALLSRVTGRNLRGRAQRLYGDAFAAEGKVEDAECSYRAALMHMRDGQEALARVESAKTRLKSPEGTEALALYVKEFDALREARRANAARRAEQGLTPERMQAQAARRQRWGALRQRIAAARARGGAISGGSAGFGRG